MLGTIPILRVNYTIGQLIKAVFINEHAQKYRNQLTETIGQYFGTENVILTSSARSAIFQICRSLPKRRVVVPAYTCEVVIEAVRLAGKEVVFADIEKQTLNIKEYPIIDADTIVIATHQYGIMCEIEHLAKECKEKGAILIEDCAGSFGGRIDGQLTGTFGDYGVFSFSASKTVHSPTKGGFIISRTTKQREAIQPLSVLAGDRLFFKFKQLLKGIGFCLANNRSFSSLLHRIGNHNSVVSNLIDINADPCYHHNFYEWQAFVVLKQFENIESILLERQKLVVYYNDNISNQLIIKPIMQHQREGVNIRYPILVSDRDSFIKDCEKHHISVGKGYNRLYCPKDCLTAHEVAQEIVYLPFGNGYSKEEINKVVKVINSFQ